MDAVPADTVYALVGSCFAAIAALWAVVARNHSRTQQKLDACEERHEECTNRMLDLSEKVGQLRGMDEMTAVVRAEVAAIRGVTP